jgi:hypothetical protein
MNIERQQLRRAYNVYLGAATSVSGEALPKAMYQALDDNDERSEAMHNLLLARVESAKRHRNSFDHG